MEIDITSFVQNADPFEFSASRAERGENAGPETWRNAVEEGTSTPLLTTDNQLDALRAHMKEFGAWEAEEIDGWSAAECNALFIQLISGDMREAGFDGCELDEFDWGEYERRASVGEIGGRIGRGEDGRVYYYLGT